MGRKLAITWDIAILAVAAAVTLNDVGVEYIRPIVTADSIAADVAPKFGVAEARLREELTHSMQRGRMRRVTIEAAPLCFIVFLLAGRLLLDWRAFRGNRSQIPE